MMTLLALIPSIALGWCVTRLLLPAERWQPAWTRWLFELALGFGVGAGISSILFFVSLWAGVPGRFTVLAVELAGLAVAAGLLFARRGSGEVSAPGAGFAWNWVLRIAAAVAVLWLVLDFYSAMGVNPMGDWDAFSIWNLRAKFLAGGQETWRLAFSSEMAAGAIGASHPGYPLLTSAFIARTWTLLGSNASTVPAAVGLLFSFSTVALLLAAVTWLRAESSGLLALLVLLACEYFSSQGASQYADIPLSLYALGAAALIAGCRQYGSSPGMLVLAGLLAGFAAWTKNEGLPLLVLVLAAAAISCSRRALAWAAAGALPGAVLSFAVKILLAQGADGIFPKTAAEAMAKLANPSRWIQVAVSFAGNLIDLGFPFAHPILLLAVLGFGLGFIARDKRGQWLWFLIVPIGLLVAASVIYVLTTADLAWHLSTSVSRVIVQVLPVLLLIYFLVLQPPVTPEDVTVPAGGRGHAGPTDPSEAQSHRRRRR